MAHATRGPGQRANLTREQVVAAAWDLVAERGAGSLTMRSLATALGVRPNALYSHVADKDALVDAVLDRALAEVEVPPRDAPDPLGAVADLMTSTYDVLLGHADLVPRYLDRQGSRGPHAQHLGEVVLALLARAGLDDAAAREALRVLIVHTIGFAAFTVAAPLGTGGEGGPPPPGWQRDSYRRSLGWLLDGIAAAA